jgi:penicillin amidase
MAEDRLWQMDRLRRRALGRQAEILGAEYVESDLLHRAVGIPEISEREVERTDAPTRAILEAFVGGINRYIEARGRDLPIEFHVLEYEPEPFTVRDSIAILRGEWWSLNGRLYTLAIGEAAERLPARLRDAFLTPEAAEHRILPGRSNHPPGTAEGLQGMSDGSGSNNWAVAGPRTISGQAMLCTDPHQPFWVPSSWYEYGLHGPEDDAAGAGHPGVPGLWFGANGTIAWGITNNAASTRDLYREHVHPTDPQLYRDGATWRRFEERVEEVRVRGQQPVRHAQRSTVRGPIVNHVVPAIDDEATDTPLALRWVGQQHLDDVRALVGIGRARDWDTFRAVLRDWSVAVFNFGYADTSGRVGYQCAGRVPIRGRTVRGYRDANEPADAWHGYIAFDELPSMVDPSRGYIASANERVAPDDYPHALYGAWGTGHRAARIHQVLADDRRPVDREQSIALQNDIKSCRAERICPPLLQWLAGAQEPDAILLRTILAAWDYRYTLDSAAPTLFEAFMHVWQQRVAREHFPAHLVDLVRATGGVASRLIERGDDQLNWFSDGVGDEIVAAASAAVESVRASRGSDPLEWQWGKVHLAYWRHPVDSAYDIGPQPVNGGPDCLRNTGAGPRTMEAAGGAEYRLVVDFAQPDRFLAVQNIGNSGVPGSPHYADQFEAWLAGSYHSVSLTRAGVQRDCQATTVLEPAFSSQPGPG